MLFVTKLSKRDEKSITQPEKKLEKLQTGDTKEKN